MARASSLLITPIIICSASAPPSVCILAWYKFNVIINKGKKLILSRRPVVAQGHTCVVVNSGGSCGFDCHSRKLNI